MMGTASAAESKHPIRCLADWKQVKGWCKRPPVFVENMGSRVNPAWSKTKQSSVVRTLRMGRSQEPDREVRTR